MKGDLIGLNDNNKNVMSVKEDMMFEKNIKFT